VAINSYHVNMLLVYRYGHLSFLYFSFIFKPILMPSLGNQTVDMNMVFIVLMQQFYYVLLLKLTDSNYDIHQ
jgi:hypothetical protein